VYSNGHHGNAILSHFPLIESGNFDVSNHRLERRGILYGVLQAPEWNGLRIHVMTLHFDLLAVGRRRQLSRLVNLIKEKVQPHEPLIVTGDFNDWGEEASEVLREKAGLAEAHFNLHGEHAKTYPSWYPFLRLDRIYVRGFEMLAVRRLHGTPWSSLSDHLALVAEFEF
jgi:endonuclease/exonuclease/phosphatase family metal-dependent hydrolase